MARCPKCGGMRYHYELRSGGTRSRTYYYRMRKGRSWLIPSGRRSHTGRRSQVSVGICPDCGYVRQSGDTLYTILGTIILIVIVMALLKSCAA